jgi:hypothetical protein
MQTSVVETLILSGSVDFSTPPVNVTERLMPYLPLATGVPDTSLATYVPMDFEVRWGYPLLAKLVVGGTMLAGLVLLGAGWMGVRFVRGRIRRRAAAAG